jgi:formate dehydrogenase subunit gamma
MSKALEPAPRAATSSGTPGSPNKIYRFQLGERFLHWALALPFVLLYSSAATLLLTWGEATPRPLHHAAALMHRGAGLCLIVLPPLALVLGIRDWRMHFENIRHGWVWNRDDVRWLILFPKSVADPRVKLPEQGKFNAAEKLNFMMVMATYPLYIVTGLLVWLPGVAFYPWLAHSITAVMGLPLIGGHIFMAAINPSTRIGLGGMFTGWVDREWAQHHYRRWYRERFENNQPVRKPADMKTLLGAPAEIRCQECGGVHAFDSWHELLRRAFQVAPLFCNNCSAEIAVLSAEASPEVAEAMLLHLESGRGHMPFVQGTPRAA